MPKKWVRALENHQYYVFRPPHWSLKHLPEKSKMLLIKWLYGCSVLNRKCCIMDKPFVWLMRILGIRMDETINGKPFKRNLLYGDTEICLWLLARKCIYFLGLCSSCNNCKIISFCLYKGYIITFLNIETPKQPKIS